MQDRRFMKRPVHASLAGIAVPIQYNAYNQAANINGQDQDYHDLGNDLRVNAGGTGLVNTRFGITARTTNAGTTYYTRMPDGRLLASHGAGGTHFYVTDHQKSITAIIGTDGQRAGTYRYAPYGESTVVETTPTAEGNPFRWHGGYYGIEGDHYDKFGARYYDSDGHFTQPDPQPGRLSDPLSRNPYTYAESNPTDATDATGRSCAGAIFFGTASAISLLGSTPSLFGAASSSVAAPVTAPVVVPASVWYFEASVAGAVAATDYLVDEC